MTSSTVKSVTDALGFYCRTLDSSLGPELATSGSDTFSSLLQLLVQLTQSLSIIDETAIPRHYPRFDTRSRPESEEKPNDFVDKFRFNCSTTYREDILKTSLEKMEVLITKLQSTALEQGTPF